MLINTVILFLRDALPIFVLLAFLLAQVQLKKRTLISTLGLGILLALLFIQLVNTLGNLFEGTGLEMSLFALHFSLYAMGLLLGYFIFHPTTNNRMAKGIVCFAIVVMIIAKGSNFLLYFNGHLNKLDALQAMSVGTLLGLGICLSLAILLYFFMLGLKQHFGPVAPWTVLLVFVSGQLVNAMNLLVQVDLLPALAPAWDSQWLLDEESEYGHLFNVLVGYLATPSYLQLGAYFVLIVCPVLLALRTSIFTSSDRGIIQ